MIWTLQFTPWALPALLALLVVGREWAFLLPRRRERGSASLLALTGLGAVWSLAALLLLTFPDLRVQTFFLQVVFIAASLTPLAWLWFCASLARRTEILRSVPAILLFALSLVTVFFAAQGAEGTPLVRELAPEVSSGSYRELILSPGIWYQVHIALRAVALVWGSVVATRHLLGDSSGPGRTLVPAAAAVVTLIPLLPQISTTSFMVSRDVSGPTIAIVSTLMIWSLMRESLLQVGPVAHTLVMEELQDPLVVLDAKGRIVDVNRRAETLLGLVAYGDVPLALGTLWASVRERAGRYARITLPVTDEEGLPSNDPDDPRPRRVFEVTLTSLTGEAGSGQTALLFRDVTVRDRMEHELRETTHALRSANAELERLANTDGLTGLANRRHFMDTLEGELDRSQRYERTLSLILLDLDHFKLVNDTHGHAAGDEVLRGTSEVLRSVSRDVDLPARLGGEELAILLPETGQEGAVALAERVRERLQARRFFAKDGTAFHVTGSIGVATWHGTRRSTPDSFLHRADTALYRAKDGGRNQVVADGVAAAQTEVFPDPVPRDEEDSGTRE